MSIFDAIKHTHMTQRLCILSQGKGSKMYTLWDFNSGSQYAKPEYIKNLSTDYETALMLAEKHSELTGRELVNDAMESLNPILRIHKWTPTMVKFGKNRGIELSECEEKFIIWVAKGCPLFDDQINQWCNHYFGGIEFNLYAQSLAVEKGLGMMHKEKFYTNEQYEKIIQRDQFLSSLVNGHHHADGQRLDLTLTCIRKTGYDSQFGYVWIYTFVDSDKRVYTHKGRALYNYPSGEPIQKDTTITCKVTMKHSTYKDEPVTFIQRLKFP